MSDYAIAIMLFLSFSTASYMFTRLCSAISQVRRAFEHPQSAHYYFTFFLHSCTLDTTDYLVRHHYIRTGHILQPLCHVREEAGCQEKVGRVLLSEAVRFDVSVRAINVKR